MRPPHLTAPHLSAVGPEPELIVPMAIACGITVLLFVAGSVVVFAMARRRLRRTIARHEAERSEGAGAARELGGIWDGIAPLWYAGTIVLGAVGIVAGFHLMREARTAKQGFVCVLLGIAHVIAIVLLTCAGLLALVHYYGPRFG
jgi:hypothetical protein